MCNKGALREHTFTRDDYLEEAPLNESKHLFCKTYLCGRDLVNYPTIPKLLREFFNLAIAAERISPVEDGININVTP